MSFELTDSELEDITTTKLIATTFKIYGSIFGICFVAFLILRAKFPSVYTFNSVRQGHITEISKERHGHVQWIWKIFKYTDDELFEQCGMSAMVYLRFLRLGLKLAAWGVFNSIYLIPINVYGCRNEEDECTSLKDGVNRASLGNISARNPSLIATTFAAYILFGKAMWYIFREFRWFTKYRHKFCTRPRPDNYTVYVGHIPKMYRSDVALLEYFRSVFSHNDVLEAKIALDVHNLDKKVIKRGKVVQSLEHSYNIRSVKGIVPKNITSLTRELHKLNDNISGEITQIERAKQDEQKKFLRDMLAANGVQCSSGDLSSTSGSQSVVTNVRRLKKDSFSYYAKASRQLMLGMSDDEADDVPEGISCKIPIVDENEDNASDFMLHAASDSSHDLRGLDSTSHSEEYGHQKSPTCDTIDTNTLINAEKMIFADDSLIVDTSEFTPLSKRRKTLKQHKTSISLTSTLGSAKKSLQSVGKTVGHVGKNVGKQVGKNVQFAYGKTVGHVGKTVANTKIGKTVAGKVNQSVIVIKKAAGKRVKNSVISVKDLAVHSAHLATKASSRMTRLLVQGEDGQVLESGFVTFTNLSTKYQSAQIIHHQTPFKFLVRDAPFPSDIIWSNVGKPHEELQFGYLLAQAATVALMIFWTFPVAFFTSLSEAESLKEVIPALEKTIEKNPWVATFLAQLSPILLVIITALLPLILKIVCRYEGHVGENDLMASLLTKLSTFMIVQIFFVQAISGSIFDSLSEMIETPSAIVNLLATSIPTQVKSFIQFVLVQALLGCSIEILRIVRVATGFARSKIGPKLTEKERTTKYLFLEPITAPEEMEYPMLYSEMALYFMVNLVYSCIAPVMSYFMVFTFGLLSVVYRHQLIYIYSAENDKGGKLWPVMINLLITCMLISEVTLISIMFLKEGILAASLLVPLLVCTVLFLFYIKQEHFRITEFVPSTICNEEDIKNHGTLDISFLHDKYLQPSMKMKLEFPENDFRVTGEEMPISPVYDNFEEEDIETPLTRNRLGLETVASVDEEAEYLESKIPYEERRHSIKDVEDSNSENQSCLDTAVSVDEDGECLESKISREERTELAKDYDRSLKSVVNEKHTSNDALMILNESNRIMSASSTENNVIDLELTNGSDEHFETLHENDEAKNDIFRATSMENNGYADILSVSSAEC